MNGTRNHMRHARTHRAGGVGCGVVTNSIASVIPGVRCCVNDAVSMDTDPSSPY